MLLWVLIAGLALPDAGVVPVDSNRVSATAAAADDFGRIWVAAAGADTSVRLYRSDDFGLTWAERLSFSTGAAVRQMELFFARGDSSFGYLFVLDDVSAGDLWLMRFLPDSAAGELLPVAVGPDTVSDFTVAADSGRRYYLYCLYANELRGGRNGTFTRSLGFGRTWEPGQSWMNCADPHLAYGRGSTIHVAWRFAANGREIHYERNRYYGTPRRWDGYQSLAGRDRWCWNPVVCPADTGDEWNNPVWLAWTVGLRDSSRPDVVTAVSPDGGGYWAGGPWFGETWLDEWAPDLAAFPGSPSGYAWLAFNIGGSGGRDKTNVRYTGANALDLWRWTKPRNASARRPSVLEGCRPRLVCARGAPRQWPGIVYASYDSGVYFSAPWLTDGQDTPRRHEITKPRCPEPRASNLGPLLPGRPFLLAPGVAGAYRVRVYDAAGRARRLLYSGPLSAEGRKFTWDGNDDAGQPAGSGMYIVVADGPTNASVMVMVIR